MNQIENNKVLFHEIQKFSDSKLLATVLSLLLVLPLTLFIFLNFNQINIGIILAISLSLFLPISLVFLIKLETNIDEDEIRIRFYPFHFSNVVFKFEKIKSIEIRKYSPLLEYGGYGIRYKLFKHEKAYNIRGNIGIQITMKDGSKILIGTQKQNELDFLVSKFLEVK